MSTPISPDAVLDTFESGGRLYRKAALRPVTARLGQDLERLPLSLRVLLESLIRDVQRGRADIAQARDLAGWTPDRAGVGDVAFRPSRVVLQDFTGVPLLVDLAALRSAAVRRGLDARCVRPRIPADLVVDHSVQVDYTRSRHACALNLAREYERNLERYKLLKWGCQAFEGFRVVPPGVGIVHQVNLEHLARGVFVAESDDPSEPPLVYPDTLVGTDSHTTMIGGLGIVGWGVGGIEAEAALLGEPLSVVLPDVVGVRLEGRLGAGATATELALRVTERLREVGVVGAFVEFFGPGAEALSVPDRATVSNMCPEYGATIGLFPVDAKTLAYYATTGRPAAQVSLLEDYLRSQGLWGFPDPAKVCYSSVVPLDLSRIEPSVAGPRRPQDRIALKDLRARFETLLGAPAAEGGFGLEDAARGRTAAVEVPDPATEAQAAAGAAAEAAPATPGPGPMPATLAQGSVVLAAITSCTNTSNPAVMVAAGLLARKAVERGLSVPAHVKTSLAPGSRVVTDYLEQTGLMSDLEALGFGLVAYGCTTCIGNSGPLPEAVERAIREQGLIAASVLSGNRNFEARIHPAVRANFLMSPPLVVAFALAGRVDIDLTREPLGCGKDGTEVWLHDLWPSEAEVRAAAAAADDPSAYRRRYAEDALDTPAWNAIEAPTGALYAWDEQSTYLREPREFFDAVAEDATGDVRGARLLAWLGDSVTTDHISPAGRIEPDSPAGQYLRAHGVAPEAFNSYGSRRGNDEVMTRGTLANVRVRNRLLPGVEGGFALDLAGGSDSPRPLYDVAMECRAAGTPLLIIAGREYGTGSSRDWAAKGTRLLGVRAVVAVSFERIHRGNLVGMGVLPCTFANPADAEALQPTGREAFDLVGMRPDGPAVRQPLTLVVRHPDGRRDSIEVVARIDTETERAYFRAGGILPHVLAGLNASPLR